MTKAVPIGAMINVQISLGAKGVMLIRNVIVATAVMVANSCFSRTDMAHLLSVSFEMRALLRKFDIVAVSYLIRHCF